MMLSLLIIFAGAGALTGKVSGFFDFFLCFRATCRQVKAETIRALPR